MLDFAREARNWLDKFSTMEVMGVPIDWFFHMVGALIIVFVGSRFWPIRKVLLVTVGVLVAKEVFDVFAKTRAEYIRAPGLDLAFDMSAGLIGAGLGWLLARRFPGRRALGRMHS